MSRSAVEVVVLDMGGVLVRLAPLPELLGQEGADESFWPRWLASETVRDFERGAIESEEFATRFVDEFPLDLTPDEFLENFSQFCCGLWPGAVQLVKSIKSSVTTALLSNTNALHWSSQPDAEIVAGLCDHSFLSYQTGLLKPDRPCFDNVTRTLRVAPEAVLFLDDNDINVEGARAAGWQAEVVQGVEGAEQVLRRYGLSARRS